VIRIVLFASLIALAAQAKRSPLPPRPPEPPRAPAPPPPPDADDDEDDGVLIAGHDEDDEDETPEPDEEDDNGKKVRIYRLDERSLKRDLRKMKRDLRSILRRHPRDEDEELSGEEAAAASGRGSATLQVKGPVTFRLNAQAGDVEVTSSDDQKVTVSISDAPADAVSLFLFGDRVEASFRGRRQLRHGKLHVGLPRGSRVDLTSMSGDVTVQKLGGEARIHTMSGDVKLAGVAKADVQTISGDAHIDDATGPVRLHTVSGHGVISTTSAAPQLEFQSASGDLDWSGLCAKDCHVSAETVSGVVRLALDPRSSFELSYSSHSGEMRDELNLAVKHAPRRKHGMLGGWLEATYGKGEGVIEADAFSGNLVVKKR
jgi:DUF4097 and DUF4098 domain-containing protein YvlB